MGSVRKGITAILLGVLTLAQSVWADSTWVYSVQVSASVQSSPPRITLSWPQDPYGANSYTVYRKSKDASSWAGGTTLSGSATSYVDNNVASGASYEYQVVKSASLGYTGYGYIYAGIDVPLVDSRGKVILVVDSSQAASLATELSRLEQDLAGDGWTVVRRDVSRTDSPANVKNVVKSAYSADPANTKAVFLFGHIPILRSGSLNVDGHQARSMPADGFYGDMDGSWSNPNNIPSDIDLMVGRVDLFNMPVAGRSETELLRNYLNKDHNWRQKRLNVPRRALIGNRFGDFNGEAFAASGFRNLEPFVGPGNIVLANEQDGAPESQKWTSMLSGGGYLWAYGCGGGSYTSMSGLGTHGTYKDAWSSDITAGDAKAVFYMMFGSWLGEWDSADNIMRAALATSTMGLTCSWAGRPHWYYHHMGLGEPIGHSARLTQNNSGLYRNQVNLHQRGVHIALMGDPTLRMHIVAPPSSVTAAPVAGGARLNWTASAESVLGYHVYRASSPAGPYSRVTSSLVSGTTYNDTSAGAGTHTYMVRAVKLESTPSGTYFNASQGAFSNGTVGGGGGTDTTPPVVNISSPVAAAIVSGTAVQLAATATDNVGVVGVQFQINGSNIGDEDMTAPYSLAWNSTGLANGTCALTAIARDAAGNRTTSATVSMLVSNALAGGGGGQTGEVVWFDDALPGGAVPGSSGGDTWSWVGSPVRAGATAHRSTGAGNQQHYFNYAWETMTVDTGDVLMAYVYLDPLNPPQQVMLQWNDGSWEHRAYWGASLNTFGMEGTHSRRAMGALPALGQWIRLEVPASQVGLEGRAVKGMAFTLFGGQATWDRVGKFNGATQEPTSQRLTINMSKAGCNLTWNTTSQVAYRVQATTNLIDWVDVQTLTASDASTSWTDPSPDAPHRFYRVVRQ